MTWSLQIPHRSRADSIADLGSNARALKSDDRAVVRTLALLAGSCGMRTVGEVLDVLKDLEHDQRRIALDRLRTKSGLATATAVDTERRIKETRMHTVGGSDPPQVVPCAADGCQAVPLHPVTWLPVVLDVKRWYCDAHADLAEPGDDDPKPPGMRLAPGGGLEEIPRADGITRALSTGAGWGP
jgi:hypothetical protein